ncbi:hypothetical protein CFHF_17970 [Caulobacter flavus]|jgi:hypothetical protein|uniref:Chromosome partitioning protein ParB n=1 Tax=Caulobacter flavus TaxID=1679497 RepID=A0A2N5CQ89_9CAUL|nr:hypothetical protein [Caulobacter flavus]AYV46255.1 hypothetical protein C1707_08305 [Caulobacter flavus]PLR09975.1 hypothetical protein CFHF_17970 [Caulobacter flavus]
MNGKPFAARPAGAEAWVRSAEPAAKRSDAFSARLTIDVTPACRGRIKIAAFARGQTVAEMIRELFDTTYPEPDTSAPAEDRR